MILKAYCFLDTKVGSYSMPMFFAHEGHALRAVVEVGSDLNTVVGRHPNDFHLYFIGEFNDQTGVLGCVGPVSLGPVSSFLKRPEPLELFPGTAVAAD